MGREYEHGRAATLQIHSAGFLGSGTIPCSGIPQRYSFRMLENWVFHSTTRNDETSLPPSLGDIQISRLHEPGGTCRVRTLIDRIKVGSDSLGPPWVRNWRRYPDGRLHLYKTFLDKVTTGSLHEYSCASRRGFEGTLTMRGPDGTSCTCAMMTAGARTTRAQKRAVRWMP